MVEPPTFHTCGIGRVLPWQVHLFFFSFWGQGEMRAHKAAEIPLGDARPDTGELECLELEGPGAHSSPVHHPRARRDERDG